MSATRALVALAVLAALLGLARLGWNVAEGDWWAYDNFAGFYLIDRSMPALQLGAMLAVAAGVWRSWRAS